jgi:hypothetical protein
MSQRRPEYHQTSPDSSRNDDLRMARRVALGIRERFLSVGCDRPGKSLPKGTALTVNDDGRDGRDLIHFVRGRWREGKLGRQSDDSGGHGLLGKSEIGRPRHRPGSRSPPIGQIWRSFLAWIGKKRRFCIVPKYSNFRRRFNADLETVEIRGRIGIIGSGRKNKCIFQSNKR